MGKIAYPPIEAYEEAVDIIGVFSTMVLFGLAAPEAKTKDKIIRNFIARSVVSLKSILALWKIDAFADCWVLHRCIVDRLFHLKSLANDKAFDIFDDWSFKQQYDYMNKIRSDPEFKGMVDPGFFKDADRQKARYAEICKRKVDWKRPRAETVAKDADWDFFYKYAYDHASSHVHPMANDGELEFLRLTKLAEPRNSGEPRLVINNSCLAMAVLLNEGLNISSFSWRRIVFNFISDYTAFLRTGSKKYLRTFYKIGSQGPNFELCKKTEKHGAFDE
jgi:hypothetical protein